MGWRIILTLSAAFFLLAALISLIESWHSLRYYDASLIVPNDTATAAKNTQTHVVQPEREATPSRWIAYSELPRAPLSTQIMYWPTGSQTLYFAYDGSIPKDKVISQTDINYPDADTITISAFLHSHLKILFPLGVDKATVMVSTSGNFLKDKSSVYYLECGGLVCVYDPVHGADPATFAEISPFRDPKTLIVMATDRYHIYQCTLTGCIISEHD